MSSDYVDLGVRFFVHREASGYLLAITTDRESLKVGPGDTVSTQRWLPTEIETPETKPEVVDLVAALRASVEAAKALRESEAQR